MRHSPFLYFIYSNGRNGVSPRAWKEKGPVFPVFCEKLHIFARTKAGDGQAWPIGKRYFHASLYSSSMVKVFQIKMNIIWDWENG